MVQHRRHLGDAVGVVRNRPEESEQRGIERRKLGSRRVAGHPHVREPLPPGERAAELEVDPVVVPEPGREGDQEEEAHGQGGASEQQVGGARLAVHVPRSALRGTLGKTPGSGVELDPGIREPSPGVSCPVRAGAETCAPDGHA